MWKSSKKEALTPKAYADNTSAKRGTESIGVYPKNHNVCAGIDD